ENDKWAGEIAFHAEWGIISKYRLRISEKGIDWNSQHFDLDDVSRVQWGSIRHSINGIPTGTTYHATIGSEQQIAVIEMRDEKRFSEFVDKLWRAVGVRILIRLLGYLKKGQEFNFDSATVRDDGIVLQRTHLFKSSERIAHTWGQIQIYSQNGAFVV